jgi:hypothetical protein
MSSGNVVRRASCSRRRASFPGAKIYPASPQLSPARTEQPRPFVWKRLPATPMSIASAIRERTFIHLNAPSIVGSIGSYLRHV